MTCKNIIVQKLIVSKIENTTFASLDIQGLSKTCILEAEPGKLDIKRREPGNLYISLLSWFTLQTSHYVVIIDFSGRFNAIDDVIQNVQRHVNLIKIHAVRSTKIINSAGNCYNQF